MTTAQDIDAIVGAARPVVDKAVDEAALVALDAVLVWLDRAQSEYPGAPPDAHELYTSAPYAYHMGWDDALMTIQRQIREARNRIQGYRRLVESATETIVKPDDTHSGGWTAKIPGDTLC